MPEAVKQNKMGTKPMFPLLVSMALPPIVSMLVQALYNIVDSIYVAQVSQNALTAVSIAAPLQNIILAIGVGTGIGVNSYIARKLGAGMKEQANNAVTHGIIMAAFHWLLLFIAGKLLIGSFIGMYTNNAEILEMGTQYGSIVVTFSFGILLQVCGEKIIQATGKMTVPMLLQAGGAIVNIILDPILIFGWLGFEPMGVRGAAIATVIGQILAMIATFLVLFLGKHEVKAEIRRFKFKISTVFEIYRVALPSMVMMVLMSVLNMTINWILSRLSDIGVTVMGVCMKAQNFSVMPVFGLMQGTRPIIGYNYGAKNRSRVFQALRITLLAAAGICLIFLLIFMLMPAQIMQLFNADTALSTQGVRALRFIGLGFLFMPVTISISAAFEGMGKGGLSLCVSLIRQFAITMLLSMILPSFMGITGVWISFPIAECCGMLVSMLLLRRLRRRDPLLADELAA